MHDKQKLVIVGLSGGVDSAVAAYKLQQQGYHVVPVFMQNWHAAPQTAGACSQSQDLQDAYTVCNILKLKLQVVDFAEAYWQDVFQYFLDEYAACRTPNPDVLCNKEIKFKAFLNYAKSYGADYIATGHYVRHILDQDKHLLYKGLDTTKDQSYFLHLLNQHQLAATLFPLGELTKQQVRVIAHEIGLPNYAKKGSTGICFIGERKFRKFLSEYLLARPGKIVTTANQVVGEHQGLMFYTLGQRQGIGVGGQKMSREAPWYVALKNIEKNTLIITQDRNYPTLMTKSLTCSKPHWISGVSPKFPFTCKAKIRYRQPEQSCTIKQGANDDIMYVEFVTPQWAIAPGQAVVFYQEEMCLGGAVIDA